ncbi:MAG: hypothetical protein A3H93_19630 [Rhodocyclales bacterium RIFCSPLOWO2_02_FULL_63_24]|nr:MAG: hypothetical protein A3H93_19630 [Rhodocyclales bacterium RIFCSPLOWO2_02_FULL_63_24]
MANNETRLPESRHAANGQDLFDHYGRLIPPKLTSAVHLNIRRRFVCVQPTIEYAAIHRRIARHLGCDDTLSVTEFECRAEGILDTLRSDAATRGIVNGVGVPFFLPKSATTDIGLAIENTYLKAVRNAFLELFPDYAFVNYHARSLEGKLQVAPGSRHERLLERMGKSPVVGYYFPCLLEYSVPAALEQMQSLPDSLILAGGFDTCATFIACPDLLLRTDEYPPLLWLAGLSGERESIGYHFEAYGYNLTFNRRAHFGQAAEYWACGLVALG